MVEIITPCCISLVVKYEVLGLSKPFRFSFLSLVGHSISIVGLRSHIRNSFFVIFLGSICIIALSAYWDIDSLVSLVMVVDLLYFGLLVSAF